jgi:hypothetical protein
VGDGAGGGVFLFPVKLHSLQAKNSRPISASVEIDFITEIDYVNDLLWRLIALVVFHPGRQARKFPVFHFSTEFLFHRAFHGRLVKEHDQRDDQKEKNNPENHTALLVFLLKTLESRTQVRALLPAAQSFPLLAFQKLLGLVQPAFLSAIFVSRRSLDGIDARLH